MRDTQRDPTRTAGRAQVHHHGSSLAVTLTGVRDLSGLDSGDTVSVFAGANRELLLTVNENDPLSRSMVPIGTKTIRGVGDTSVYVTLAPAMLTALGVGGGDELELRASPGRIRLCPW